jgi:hypothetical protein
VSPESLRNQALMRKKDMRMSQRGASVSRRRQLLPDGRVGATVALKEACSRASTQLGGSS